VADLFVPVAFKSEDFLERIFGDNARDQAHHSTVCPHVPIRSGFENYPTQSYYLFALTAGVCYSVAVNTI